ncbi:hypothetical protein [Umezawaea sp.]|uniref:hypothetical protein n=1 Tax=Umezawaea sp. TaxID=1955258 RepID=UPI0039C9AD90
MVTIARRVARLAAVTTPVDTDGEQVVHAVNSALFFASSDDLVTQFGYAGDPGKVVIDLITAHALGRLFGGRDHDQARRTRQDRGDHRARRAQREDARRAHRSPSRGQSSCWCTSESRRGRSPKVRSLMSRDDLWTLRTSIFPENRARLALRHSAGYRIVRYHGRWRDTVFLERRCQTDPSPE